MNRTTCAIHQPNLFPRLPTLAKLYAADVWVVLDDVQFTARDYQQRAWLEDPHTMQGEWLSLSVHRPHGRRTLINQVRLADPSTSARRVRRMTRHYYGRCRRWPHLQPLIEHTATGIETHHDLAHIAERSTRLLLTHMGWQGTVVRSSSLPARPERSQRLADLTAAVGAHAYLCGPGGARYLDETPFAEQGITVRHAYIPALAALRERRQTTGLWWLAVADWKDLHGLLWRRWVGI
ncbi:WbqC family protein [Actinokineospora auranticolor]|uniref:WbqC-like protein n=1 Tax=Actinokineospora auranticolor TaxID=155976 RepID=A0A2S6GLW1_9PSEU|nr:WbqC family protein [Actinokineospora auranticolor]PPK66218.1 WbqC-like protein [Actinokineospora auranticolor]